MSNRRYAATIAAVGLVVQITAVPNPAQAQARSVLEEIIVTARRVEENLMEVPIPIAVLSGETLRDAGVRDLNELSNFTPGLYVNRGNTALGRNLTFRGLPVATGQVFIDGAPYTGDSNLYLGDLERVEVLVGPQSVYFGRATFSGALNYVTRTPSDEFSGEINAEYGEFDTHKISASVEGPLGDRMTGRLSVQRSSHDGHWRSFTDPSVDLHWIEHESATATLVAEPSDNMTVRVNLLYNLEDSGPRGGINLIGNNPDPNVIRSLSCDLGGDFSGRPDVYHCGALPTADEVDPRIISINPGLNAWEQEVFFERFPQNPLTITLFDRRWKPEIGVKQLMLGAAVQIDRSFANGWDGTLSVARFYSKEQNTTRAHFRDERGLVPNPLFGTFPPDCVLGSFGCGVPEWIGIGPLILQNVADDYSLELRATSPQDRRLRGTAGLNWLLSKGPGGTNNGFVPPIAGTITCCPTKFEDSTPAIFGGLYFDITPNLTFGAEARYQRDKLERQSQLTVTEMGAIPVPGEPFSNTWTSFSPRVTLDYTIDNTLFYALWSRGFRPGGFNDDLVESPQSTLEQLAQFNAEVVFEQERIENFEVGAKSTWLDGRLQTNLGVYTQDWSKGQLPQSIVLVGTGGSIDLFNLIVNIGEVDLHGFEGQVRWAVTDNWSLNATLELQTSDLKRYEYLPHAIRIQGNENVNGNEFHNTRDATWTLSPQYTAPIFGGWEWSARLDWRHQGKYYTDPTNVAWIDSHEIVDASIGFSNDRLDIRLYGKNLTDDDHFLNASYQFGDQLCCVVNGIPRPANVNAITALLPFRRQFGVRVNYNF